MKTLFFAAIFCLISMPTMACLNSGNSTDTYVELCPSATNCIRVNLADLQEPNTRRQEEEIRDILQRSIDTRVPLTQLPIDDPDRFTDPNRNGLFWANSDANRDVSLQEKTHLISRSAVISIHHDGSLFQISWGCT